MKISTHDKSGYNFLTRRHTTSPQDIHFKRFYGRIKENFNQPEDYIFVRLKLSKQSVGIALKAFNIWKPR